MCGWRQSGLNTGCIIVRHDGLSTWVLNTRHPKYEPWTTSNALWPSCLLSDIRKPERIWGSLKQIKTEGWGCFASVGAEGLARAVRTSTQNTMYYYPKILRLSLNQTVAKEAFLNILYLHPICQIPTPCNQIFYRPNWSSVEKGESPHRFSRSSLFQRK